MLMRMTNSRLVCVDLDHSVWSRPERDASCTPWHSLLLLTAHISSFVSIVQIIGACMDWNKKINPCSAVRDARLVPLTLNHQILLSVLMFVNIFQENYIWKYSRKRKVITRQNLIQHNIPSTGLDNGELDGVRISFWCYSLFSWL